MLKFELQLVVMFLTGFNELIKRKVWSPGQCSLADWNVVLYTEGLWA